ncbi:hypothetical protein BB561_003420 [Smittium simulii]|uniref:Protein YOP1 n=1 Tax=Smittium simulii TaxID=133385 RepID=A0A2T9YLH4_9FUNG|nr:hypothetical protein BB561_003420 [Smittium simulii]
MDQAKAFVLTNVEILNKSLTNVQMLNTFEQKTKIPKAYAVGGSSLVFLLFIMFGIGARFLVNLFGFGYAAYASIGALESPGKEDDTQWLTYWVIYGILNLVEHFTSFVLYWIPFYFTLKTVLLAWLMLPSTKGAEKLYIGYIRPAYVGFNAKINSKTQ